MSYFITGPRVRYLVRWSRLVKEQRTDWDHGGPRYVEVEEHYVVPVATMEEARAELRDLAWMQGETEGRGVHGSVRWNRPPYAVRIDRVSTGEPVDLSHLIARARAWWRRHEAADRARREERERQEKRARLEALKRELGEDR